MDFINWIVGRLNDASDYFYNLYLECYYAPYIPEAVANWFYSLSTLFSNLAWDFYYFGQWVDTTATKLLDILSWSTIQSYITNWFYYLSDLSVVFYYFWQNVTTVVNGWWTSIGLTVQGWIDTAKALLQSQIDAVNTIVTDLQSQISYLINQMPSITELLSWFANWWSNILTNLTSWWNDRVIDIQSLIDSAFILRQGFWEGWQDWKDKVTEFFTDPEDWLYKAVDRIIERFW